MLLELTALSLKLGFKSKSIVEVTIQSQYCNNTALPV